MGFWPVCPSHLGCFALLFRFVLASAVLLYMKNKGVKILRKPNIQEVSNSVHITCAEYSSYNLARFVNTLSDMMQKYQSELLSDTSNSQDGDASSVSVFFVFCPCNYWLGALSYNKGLDKRRKTKKKGRVNIGTKESIHLYPRIY